MSTTPNQYKYLGPDPYSSYKELRVKGRRIRATTLYGLTVGEGAMTPAEVAADYELPLEAVLEAIAYCESNPPEIARDLALDEALAEARGMNDPNYKYHGKPKLLSAQDIAQIEASVMAWADGSQGVIGGGASELQHDSVNPTLSFMSTPSNPYEYLAPNPKSAYRQLFVKGTRIRARTIYGMFAGTEERMTPEEIAADQELPLAAVLEAIAYCESNPPELLQDYAREEARLEATGMNAPGYKSHGKPESLTAQEIARLESS
jgi:uncharacterized protein (DUF433 family)